MNTFNILDPAACGKKIDRIARVGKALQNDIHVVAVSTLAHIRDHGRALERVARPVTDLVRRDAEHATAARDGDHGA